MVDQQDAWPVKKLIVLLSVLNAMQHIFWTPTMEFAENAQTLSQAPHAVVMKTPQPSVSMTTIQFFQIVTTLSVFLV